MFVLRSAPFGVLLTLSLLLVGCPPEGDAPDPFDPPDQEGDDPVDDDDDDDTPPPDGEDALCSDAFEAPQTRFVSADDSNSQADPAHQRHLMTQYGVIQSDAKAWEYLNYFDFDYAPAEPGHLRIDPQLVEVEGEPGSYEMVVAVVAPTVQPEDRAPLNLVFSVDTSCSMGGSGITGAKATMEAIAGALQTGDVVSMVTWSSSSSTVLESHTVLGPADPTLMDVIDGLGTDGGTNLYGGLQAAYALAEDNLSASRTNRVVLISDGGANLGPTEADLIAEHAEDGDDVGIYMLGIGTPPATNYNDVLMDEVTDLGRGAYFYVDSADEAERQFTHDRLPQVFEVVARDVQMAITLPPGFVVAEFTGEEIGNTPSEVTPQHLAPNDQMIYDLDLLDCSADAATDDLEFTFTVEWFDPATSSNMVDTVTMSVAELLSVPHRQLDKATAIVAYAQAFGETASMAASQRGAIVDDVIDQLEATSASLGGDDDLDELLELAQTWRDMLP